jgi:hypothetical protein
MSKRFFKHAIIAFTFLIASLNFTFYLIETMTGKPVLANSLKVLGFCPAVPTPFQKVESKAPSAISGTNKGETGETGAPGVSGVPGTPGQTGATGPQGEKGEKGDKGETGATGPQGETGATGATGPAGSSGGGATVCAAPINLYALPGDLIPAADNVYGLGNAQFRWKDLQLGPGTLYIEDVTTGLQAGITVDGGTLLLDGADSLRIGNIRLTKKGIESVLSDQDITFGNLGDRGYALFANGIKFPDGTIQTSAIVQGIKGDAGATGETGAQGATGETGAQGATGETGAQGVQGFKGEIGATGLSGGAGSIGPQGIQGIQGLPGSMSAYYGHFYSDALQTNPTPNAVNAMTFNTTTDVNGITIVDSSKLRVTYAGVYNLQFSAQLNKTDSGDDSIDIWLAKNGVNVPWSNTRSWLVGNNAKQVAAWNFVMTLAAGDYVQLYWSSADADVRLYAEAAQTVPIRPGVPSVIATLTQVAN